MGYIYLASPYSHPDSFVRSQRYLKARNAVADMLLRKRWVYSPIVHCHDLAVAYAIPFDAWFWRDYNLAMLHAASAFAVLELPGWRESVGVAAEVQEALRLKLPLELV